jgi:hypothetical protein
VANLRQLLCTALVAGAFLTSGTAEARFGKRSSSKQEEKKERKKKSGEKKVHDASPVGSRRDDDCCRDSGGSSRGRVRVGGSGGGVLIVNPRPRYLPSSSRAVRYARRPVEQRAPLMVRMGMDGQSMEDGAAAAFNVGLEGMRWGVAGSGSTLALLADDGTDAVDRIHLMGAHLTYALLTGERGRLRLELGAASAHAPSVTFVGPSLGASFERCLFWAFDVEGRAQLVPLPHLQLDTQVGLAMHLGALSVRGGYRVLVLDDRGLVDGVPHRDRLAGPYMGLGLQF